MLLVPTLSFYAGLAIAAATSERTSLSAPGMLVAAPLYVGFVGAPTLLVVRTAVGRIKYLVLVLLIAVATVAGWLVASTDDGQAGLAVLWVPYVALPLALVLAVARWIASVRHRRLPTNRAD